MIDKYLLEDLSLRSDEKGELARWVIQLQADVDTERRKSASLESVIYARDTRIAELEAQVNVWESAALKHLARAEEAEKRLPILEQDKLRLNEIINSEANRADAAEKRLATPVRLPDIRSDDYHETGWFQHMKYYRDVERSLRAVGFKVEEDE